MHLLTKKLNKEPWIEKSKRFATHSSTWQSGAKGQGRDKFFAILHLRSYGFSQGWKCL